MQLFFRQASRWGYSLILLAVLLVFPPPVSAHESDKDWAIELGTGATVLFDSDMREVFGTPTPWTLGISKQLEHSHSWVLLEAGWIKASGREFIGDPTFEIEDSTFRIIPVSLGVRLALDNKDSSDLRLFFGLGAQFVFAEWDQPLVGERTASTTGFYMELQPEVALGESLALFLRGRVSALLDASFPDISGDRNFSANTLGFGLRLFP